MKAGLRVLLALSLAVTVAVFVAAFLARAIPVDRKDVPR